MNNFDYKYILSISCDRLWQTYALVLMCLISETRCLTGLKLPNLKFQPSPTGCCLTFYCLGLLPLNGAFCADCISSNNFLNMSGLWDISCLAINCNTEKILKSTFLSANFSEACP